MIQLEIVAVIHVSWRTIMRPIYVVFALTLLLSAQCGLRAATRSDGEAKARDYSVGGVTFGMSLVDFEKKFSLGHRNAPSAGGTTVTREVSVAAGKMARFEFNRGRLSAISVVFTFEGNDRVESEAAVASQTTQMFGKPDRDDDAALRWSFPGMNRVVTCGSSQSDYVVRVTDTSTTAR
jgi:hypothetical protein